MKPAMLETFTDRSTVLTVNTRLARWLLLKYNRRQADSGLKIWPTPSIKPLDSWMRETWLRSWPEKHILNETQSLKLWEEIIRSEQKNQHLDLLYLHGAAKEAAKAYNLIVKYRIHATSANFKGIRETETFYKWMKEYEERLKKMKAIDPSTVVDELMAVQKKGDLLPPEEIILTGFDEIYPQLREWIDFLKDKKVVIKIPDDPPADSKKISKNRHIQIREYLDRTQEVVQCARWIRSVHSPEKTIGVVVPQIDSYKSLIKREFTAELSPGSELPWNEAELPFNISLGTPLRNEPIVHLALLILSTMRQPVPFKIFYSVLTSPFLKGGTKEIPARIELEKFLRNNKTSNIYLNQVLQIKLNETADDLTSIIRCWEGLINLNGSSLPSQWAHKFTEVLKEMGWPDGDKKQNSAIYQTRDKWNHSLDQLASLDQIIGHVSRQEAVNILGKITESPFTRKTPEEPVQVLGLLEFSRLKFDHLWVMGCHLDNLPATPLPNPFIPINIQKQVNLPHSSAEWELEYSEQTLRRLVSSATDIVFSFPAWEKESPMTLSPLLRSLNNETPTVLIEASHTLTSKMREGARLEVFNDSIALPASKNELAEIRGGQSILQKMAECPFSAFATHRLHSKKLEDPEIDIDSSKRGSLVHQVLELFWKEVKTHSELLKLIDEDELSGRVQQNVATVIKNSRDNFFGQKYFAEMEMDRLTTLTMEWLEKDMERMPFRVEEAERKIEITLEGLKLKLKVDRIDITENGDTIIIDYKTNTQSPKDWFSPRILQPQLPLYCQKVPASAIAFAIIKKGSYKFQGTARGPNILPPLKPDDFIKDTQCLDWEDLNAFWKDNLNTLARDFVGGKLIVDPIKQANPCRYCGLQSLCRIEEQTVLEDEEEIND